MDDKDRAIVKDFVTANVTTSREEAAWRIRSVRLTAEELIFAWHRAGVEFRGGVLKTAIMDRILELQEFDDWVMVALKINLRPYRTWAVAHLRNFECPTEAGVRRLAKSKSKSLSRLADQLRPRIGCAS